jgi:hypothetical protein
MVAKWPPAVMCPQGCRQPEKVHAAVLELGRQADHIRAARRDPAGQVRDLRAVIEAQHLHPVTGACRGCRDHAHAQVLFDIRANQGKSHFGPPFSS